MGGFGRECDRRKCLLVEYSHFITWDDWGGWYDHVAPKVIDDGVSWGSSYVYGFRVPLIVVSPYAKLEYISHVTHDFGSILNIIEHIYSLPSLGYADARADDLSDCFNFNQSPTPLSRSRRRSVLCILWMRR